MTPRLHGVAAEYSSPESLLAAVRGARAEGYTRMDAFTPYPVHGLDRALGLRRSRLGYLAFGGGVAGMLIALLLQWWTGAVDYPLVIGGKPLFAFEFSIPVTFELTVLLASFGAVFGMLAANGLPRLSHPVFRAESFRRVTDDGFMLLIEGGDPKFEPEACARLLASLGATRTEVVEEDAG
ncbi:MAG TPA: DUF3341 domain-containing protein [Bryobacteraceae bacterium]|nr:DUF3341 domain-containing protein [Bryobacteraceae bacterium]